MAGGAMPTNVSVHFVFLWVCYLPKAVRRAHLRLVQSFLHFFFFRSTSATQVLHRRCLSDGEG